MRAELKRLVDRNVLTEPAPGLAPLQVAPSHDGSADGPFSSVSSGPAPRYLAWQGCCASAASPVAISLPAGPKMSVTARQDGMLPSPDGVRIALA